MTTVPPRECGGREAHHEQPAATQPTTHALLLAGTLATTLALTACSQNSSGTPTPAEGTTETTTTSTTTSSTASTSPIADIDPCALLTPTERTQLGGLGEPKMGPSSSGKSCDWSAGSSHGMAVELNDKLGIQDLKDPGGTSVDLTVNG